MKQTLFLLIFAVLVSCIRKNNAVMISKHGEAMVIQMNSPKIDFETLGFSDFEISHYIVQLQSSPSNLIGQIDEVLAIDNFLFILDSRVSKKVFQFDRKGSFIQIIGKYGYGPGEYIQPEDISYDSNNELLIVFEKKQRKVIAYSLDGVFIYEKSLKFDAHEIQSAANNRFLVFNHDIYNPPTETYTDDLNYNLLIFDTDFSKPISKIFKTNAIPNEGKSVYKNGRYFNQDGDTTYISWRFNDTTYAFVNNNVYPRLIFNFGQRSVKWDIYEESSSISILPKLLSGEFLSLIKPVLFINGVFLTQYVSIDNPGRQVEDQVFTYIGSSTTGYIFKHFINDHINIEIPFPIGTTDGHFVSVLYPEALLESHESLSESLVIDGVGKVNRFDNPLLCLFKINQQSFINEENTP